MIYTLRCSRGHMASLDASDAHIAKYPAFVLNWVRAQLRIHRERFPYCLEGPILTRVPKRGKATVA